MKLYYNRNGIMCESEKGLEISATTCILLSVLIIVYDAQILVGPFQFLEGKMS